MAWHFLMKRQNKLFCQFFDEQPPRVCHFPHVIRSLCFKYGKCIYCGNIKACYAKEQSVLCIILSKNNFSTSGQDLISTPSFRPVVINYELWFFLFTVNHRFVVVLRARENNSFRFFLNNSLPWSSCC